MDITKESEKILCCMYKIYLERRKNGESRATAKEFKDGFHKSDKHLRKIDERDIEESLAELNAKGYIKIDILDNAKLEDSTIIYMGNRFKKGASEILDFLTHFIP